ncbi:MAG: winged helix-turn-helix domain-containing protein [Candidatus Kariarchaeaceae archaeon]
MTTRAEPSSGHPLIKAIEIIADPTRIRIMLDETRSEILKIMKDGIYRDGVLSHDLSVSEIAERLGSPPQRIYHHVDKLVEFEFIEKSREEKKIRSITTYYQRTAKAFIISFDSDNPSKDLTSKTDKWVRSMLRSFGIRLHDHEIYTLIELIAKLWQKSAQIIEKLSEKVLDDISYKNFDKSFGFLNEIMLHNDPAVQEIRDQISSMILPNFHKPDIDQDAEPEIEVVKN